MKIQHNISLKNYNTFGIDVKAQHFVEATTVDTLQQLMQLNEYPTTFLLGGGSNMLLTRDIENTLVIHVNLKGKTIISQDQNHVLVKAQAGENWHEFVLWSLDNDFGGLENMSLIPGNIGTAPIQNIGAYGRELKDFFVSCEAVEKSTGALKTFTLNDCNFGYRDSVFKQALKNKYIITSVTLKLTKGNHHLDTSYGAIAGQLKKKTSPSQPLRMFQMRLFVLDNQNYPILMS